MPEIQVTGYQGEIMVQADLGNVLHSQAHAHRGFALPDRALVPDPLDCGVKPAGS
jgi:hypothetical protein